MNDEQLRMNRRQVLLATAGATLVMGTQASIAADSKAGVTPVRSQSFDPGWRFHRGEGTGFEQARFDDSSWRAVDLPHDWSVEDLPVESENGKPRTVGPFDPKAPGGTATGFTIGGEGWYRKHFHLDKPARGRVEILFEGIYMNSDVWVNGRHVGNHPYGYTPFAYDLTPHLAASGDNVIAVRVRNLGQNSRWYSGSGIYRHVWLDVLTEPSRIARWGVGIFTKRIDDDSAHIAVTTRLDDIGAGLTVISRIKDEHGRVVKEVAAPAATVVEQALSIDSPRLWSPDKPALYALETELRRDDVILDRSSQSFGVRIVTFDAAKGMTINGVPTKLRGGCIHHDNGLLGAAAFDAAEERKVALLRARGFNAVRPAHNPYSPAFLRACDRQGMLVICEAFDVWSEKKLPQDYSVDFAERWRADLTAMVLSARNHPSIVLWSIGNEIPGRNLPAGVETQWRLANEVHKLDPTRPVTAGINGFGGRPVTPSQKAARVGLAGVPDQTSVVFLDVVGYNYKLAEYVADHERYPKRVLYGSESFPKDVAATWDLTDRQPWLLGDFVWTAMDHLGEAGIGGSVVAKANDAANPMTLMSNWPWVNSFCGDIDLIGRQKPQSLLRDVVWGLSPVEITVQRPVPEGSIDVPRLWGWPDEHRSWTWSGNEGKPLAVRVYTSGDRVELQLNGRTLESKNIKPTDLKRVEFGVTYEPGVLEAISFRAGKEIGRRRLATVGAPAGIRLKAERANGGAGRGDVSYVGLEIVDAEERVVPGAAKTVRLRISGPAELIALGSANPLAVGSLQSTATQTWDGHALIVMRGVGRPGKVTLEAHGEGLRSGGTTVHLS